MIEENDKRLKFVPLDEATTPPGGLIQHLKNRWWVVHPSKGVTYWVSGGLCSPQCNSNQTVTEHFRESMYPWCEVRFISSVFRRIDPRDYV